jgi:multiple sugar transport system permease protein
VVNAPSRTWHVTLGIAAVVFVAPFAIALATSFRTLPDIAEQPVRLWPGPGYGWTLDGWRRLTGSDAQLLRAAFNSTVVTVVVVIGRIAFCSAAGYALSTMRFAGRRVVLALVLAVLAVPPIVLAVPRFLVMDRLDILNSYAGLTIPLMFDAFGIFLMKQSFDQLPSELSEAARLDGAGPIRMFWSVLLPLTRPGLIALTVLSSQNVWNEFLHPLIATPSERSLRTLPVELAFLAGGPTDTKPWNALLLAAVCTTVPIALLFFAFQRHFVQGVAASALKD